MWSVGSSWLGYSGGLVVFHDWLSYGDWEMVERKSDERKKDNVIKIWFWSLCGVNCEGRKEGLSSLGPALVQSATDYLILSHALHFKINPVFLIGWVWSPSEFFFAT